MPSPRRAPLTVAFAVLAAASVACEHRHAPPPSSEPPASPAPAPSASVAQTAPLGNVAPDAGPYDGPWLGAIVLQAPIWSEMEWPDKKGERESKSYRLGYLRYGERAAVIPEPHAKANCPEGWYELLSGGFVCGRYATLDLDHPKFKLAKAPDLDGPLPYTYGVNLWNGTPLYRAVPSRAQRKRFEPWLFKPKKPKVVDDDAATPSASAAVPSALLDGGADDDPDADTPWWERDEPDGGPPQITLEDLQESGGPIARRMVKGFFLSLDREIDASGTKWWKTVAGLSAPADRILVSKPVTEFHGVWLGKDDASYPTKNVPSRRIDKLPVAFVIGYYAKRWVLDDAHKHATVADGALDRFDAFGLTGEQARANGYDFWETDQGFWLRSNDATKTEPGPAPDKLGEHEKWIDVNLRRQTLVAFEGATPVFVTLVSSGRNEHETPPGSFRIREKHISATMDGDSDTAADGPYSIEDVPYIEYFNAGYALHGAFWHGQFGSVKSHGCVNLAPWDAKAVFGWTEPQLPDGWHAVYASKEKPGTRVVVHERGPGTCEGPNAAPPQCPDR
jgi:lipoprotein-anchoring transpeptidase ErfK/SrfK